MAYNSSIIINSTQQLLLKANYFTRMRVPLCISDNPSNYRSTYLILHINIHVYIHTPYTYYIEYIYILYLYLNIILYIDREAMGRCGPELFLRGPCARGTWRPFQRLGHGEVRRWQFFSAGNSPRNMVMGIGVLGIHD